jgi:hypothetical protein
MAVVGAAILISILSFKNVAFDKPQEKK